MKRFTTISTFLFLLGCLWMGTPHTVIAQNNDPNNTLTVVKDQDLNFGNVMYQSGITRIDLSSPNKATVSITGVKFMEVLVEITADKELLLNGNTANAGDPARTIPYTLEAAYQNQGLPASNTGAAVLFTVTDNTGSEQFKVLDQGSSSGPSNPPGGGNKPLPEATAYIYIYGSINVGTVSSGPYQGNINVTVTYN